MRSHPALYDAQAAFGFLVQQLNYIEAEVYRIKYPELDYASLIPVDSSAPEWIKTIEFRSIDMTGQARWQAGNAFDIPMADIVRARGQHSIHMAAIGYEWTVEEINTARLAGIGLDSDKTAAARRAYEQFMYTLAMSGDTEKNLTGLFNASGMTGGNVAADGAGSSRLWSTKTPTQILRDVNDLLSGIWTGSLFTETADTLLLPFDALMYASNTPMSATNSETILSFLKKNNVYTATTGRELTIRYVRGLENAGANTSDGRMIAYLRDPGVLKLHLPMPHRFLPIWQNGPMQFQKPGIFRTGGVEVRRPGAMRYADGIVA